MGQRGLPRDGAGIGREQRIAAEGDAVGWCAEQTVLKRHAAFEVVDDAWVSRSGVDDTESGPILPAEACTAGAGEREDHRLGGGNGAIIEGLDVDHFVLIVNVEGNIANSIAIIIVDVSNGGAGCDGVVNGYSGGSWGVQPDFDGDDVPFVCAVGVGGGFNP